MFKKTPAYSARNAEKTGMRHTGVSNKLPANALRGISSHIDKHAENSQGPIYGGKILAEHIGLDPVKNPDKGATGRHIPGQGGPWRFPVFFLKRTYFHGMSLIMKRSKAFEAWRQKFRNISLSLFEKLRVVYKSIDFLS